MLAENSQTVLDKMQLRRHSRLMMGERKAIALSRAERELLKAATGIRLQRRRAKEAEWQATVAFISGQQKVARAFHKKVFDRALRAAGIDPQQLSKRHERERASALRFFAKRKQEAFGQASEVNKAHRLSIDELITRRRLPLAAPPAPPGPPPAPSSSPTFTLVTSPTTITLEGGQATSYAIAPKQNIVHTKVERYGWVSSLKWDLRGDMAFAHWNFLWAPPRDGMMNVISALAMNGLGVAYPGPGCIAGSSSWSLDATITLTQIGTTGSPLTDSFTTRVAEERFGSGDLPSGGGVIFTGTRLDQVENLVFDKYFPVLSQVPLLVTVTATLYVLVAHGEAELNFADRGFQLNVPYVYLCFF